MGLMLSRKELAQHTIINGRFVSRQGISVYTCTSCHTAYPVLDGVICCNGEAISVCPYCDTRLSNK